MDFNDFIRMTEKPFVEWIVITISSEIPWRRLADLKNPQIWNIDCGVAEDWVGLKMGYFHLGSVMCGP